MRCQLGSLGELLPLHQYLLKHPAWLRKAKGCERRLLETRWAH